MRGRGLPPLLARPDGRPAGRRQRRHPAAPLARAARRCSRTSPTTFDGRHLALRRGHARQAQAGARRVIRLAVRVRAPPRRSCSPSCSSSRPPGVEETDLDEDVVEYALYGAAGRAAGPAGAQRRRRATPSSRSRPPRSPDDWADRWKAWHRPVDVAWRFRRLRVRPPWEEPLAEDDGIDLVIDPGQAFGTGAHHTTRLCLELLLELDPGGALADWGSGSGVLAIAAARLGYDPVLARRRRPGLARGVDRERASVNGVADRGAAGEPAARAGAVRADRARQPRAPAAARRRAAARATRRSG